MTRDERYRLNGILATVVIHLILVVFFLLFKIGEAKYKHEETLKIEILDDIRTVEEIIKPKEIEIPDEYLVPGEAAKNIAVNVAEKINNEISTDKYIEEVKEELGIEELNQKLDRTLPDKDVPTLADNIPDKKKEEGKKPVQFKGRTNMFYNLENRWHRRQYVPVYRCEVAGTVVVDIVVDQIGNVISASYSKSSNTNNECLVEEAVNSAYKFLFNADSKADSRQKGTITFQFLSQ